MKPATRRAFLGLGSNIGDRREYLRQAVGAISDVVAVSPVYETEPVGVTDQQSFYNIVVELNTHRGARELLELCRDLEQAAERVREIRWGPRTLDVDVLYVEGETVDDDDLVVPHPRMAERNFVMVPLLDLDPELDIPGYDPTTAFGAVSNIGVL